MSLYLASIILLYGFGLAEIDPQKICPSLTEPGEECFFHYCKEEKHYCTFVVDNAYCCDWSNPPCNETGMNSFSFVDQHKVYYLWKDIEGGHESSWYKKKININYRNHMEIACPLPRSMQFAITAADFSAETLTPPRKCGKSQDCKPKEFCGEVYNPSYCDNPSADYSFKRQCRDHTRGFSTTLFCFPEPAIPGPGVLVRRDKDLAACSSQSDCTEYRQKTANDVFCVELENAQIKTGARVYESFQPAIGICAELMLCENSTHVSPFASLSKSGTTDCTKDDDCNGENAKCVESHMNGILGVCCNRIPEPAAPKIDYDELEEKPAEKMTWLHTSYGVFGFIVVVCLSACLFSTFRSIMKKRKSGDGKSIESGTWGKGQKKKTKTASKTNEKTGRTSATTQMTENGTTGRTTTSTAMTETGAKKTKEQKKAEKAEKKRLAKEKKMKASKSKSGVTVLGNGAKKTKEKKKKAEKAKKTSKTKSGVTTSKASQPVKK